MTTQVKINQNSHIAAMCETTRPNLCEKHLAEVRNDGDLLKVLATDQDSSCDMCEVDASIMEGDDYQHVIDAAVDRSAVREGRNWADSKCAYGYMTLCAPCAQEVRESNRRGERSWSHVDATKEVPGFPVFECERCKKACAPPDNNAYQQEKN